MHHSKYGVKYHPGPGDPGPGWNEPPDPGSIRTQGREGLRQDSYNMAIIRVLPSRTLLLVLLNLLYYIRHALVEANYGVVNRVTCS